LGSDEREESAACIEEGKSSVDWDRFERKLSELVGLMGIDPDQIIRHENREGKVYSSRTGKITHYCSDATTIGERKDEKFFVTVDIYQGSLWEIYQETRKVVSLGPTAVLAETRAVSEEIFAKYHVGHRLLAFSMGLSSPNVFEDASAFKDAFVETCKALDWADCEDESVGSTAVTVPVATEGEGFRARVCDVYTYKKQTYVAQEVVDAVAF